MCVCLSDLVKVMCLFMVVNLSVSEKYYYIYVCVGEYDIYIMCEKSGFDCVFFEGASGIRIRNGVLDWSRNVYFGEGQRVPERKGR